MTIRLHPATPHGDRLHRLGEAFHFPVANTRCGIRFAWGDWKDRSHGPLPRCEGCWDE